MECPKCKTNNREGRRFCSACGAPLSSTCPACGFAVELGERFCGNCGKPLGAAPAPPKTQEPAAETQAQPSEAERRHLTVVFCDLVDSSALSARLDPEDLREVVRAYQQTTAEVVQRFGGHIAQYLGDGLLIYFGYPAAHEDAGARAVHFALGTLEAIAALNLRLAGRLTVALAVRIGVHTGTVVIGEVGAGARSEHLALGEAPNVAARLHAIAEPNAVVISASTHRLVEGLFQCDDLGPQGLKGFAEPVNVYRVRSTSDAPTRFEAVAQRGLTPLVGREEEIGFLLKRWGLALDGEAQVVLLEGEAGIGKSRLLRSFRERLEKQPHSRLLYYGSPYHQHSAYFPVIDRLKRGLRLGREDGPQASLEKLDATLGDLGLSVAESAPLLASLLALPAEGRYPKIDLTPEQLKRRTIEVLAAMVKSMERRQPVLMVVEDMHWIDPSTIEFLTVLIEQLRGCRFLLVCSFRPGYAPPWKSGDRVSAFSLTRLSRRESAAIVAELSGGKSLPEEVLQEIMTKTGGIPLFVEELTKMVLESGLLKEGAEQFALSGPLPQLAIPASLQDSLMARLDRLAPIKELAQLAATLGRTFSHELIAAVSPLDKAHLEDALEQLVRAELLYRHGLPPDVGYEFKHALVRDVAYQSLLKSTRHQHHQRIARVLEERFSAVVDGQPELVARHYTEAGLPQQAIAYWRKAGEKAAAQWANLEAIDHLRKALELLRALPEGSERNHNELQLQLTLAAPLTATSGYAAADVERVYSRAHRLCQDLGASAEVFPALYGLWRYRLLRAEYSSARELGEQLRGLAESARDPVLELAAHRALGATLFYVGSFAESQAHLERARALESRTTADSGALINRTHDVADPQIASRSYASWGMWMLGHTERATALSGDTVALAERRAHPFSSALALSFAGWLHQFAADARAAHSRAAAALRISTERSFPFWIGWNRVLIGWALSQLEPQEAAVSEIQEGLKSWRAQGSALGSAYFLALLADTHATKGETEAGLEALEQAERFSDTSDERFWYAEQRRLRGELLLQRGAAFAPEARACFLEALEIARAQSAKSLELRAAMSLGRMSRGNGASAEARAVLGEVYGWFKEGLQSADLVEARSLLEQMAA